MSSSFIRRQKATVSQQKRSLFQMFFFLPLLLCSSIHTVVTESIHRPKLKYGSETFDALQRLLKFFESDASHLNLDGLYGVRIAQGQLMMLNQDDLIRSLIDQIERIANVSLTNIAIEQADYLQRFALVASRPFLIEYEPRQIKKHLIHSAPRTSHFDEDESDQCFGELLGSNNSSQCLTSEACWKLMTSPMSADYRLTHQLLWFIMAKNIGCLSNRVVTGKAEKHFYHLEDQFCANIYDDARRNFLNHRNEDLFLEQLLLCSMIGYEEFLRADWLMEILKWQNPENGCFSDTSDFPLFIQKPKRHLLFEQEMNNGCLSHKSGLAAGLLATYFRVFSQSEKFHQ